MDVPSTSEGTYLTNGEELFFVLRSWAPSGQVMLEDCSDPSRPAILVSVRDLVADGMRVVRPRA